MKRCLFPSLALAASFCAMGAACGPSKPVKRPVGWAKRLERRGLPNLHRVDEALYRGAQPSRRGMKELEALGVKTVVNLRSMHSDEVELRGRSLDGRHIVFNVFEPKMKQVIRFLLLAGDPARHPVFVHCKHGADRTGMMVAFYRIVYQGWTKKQAIREMTAGGFGFHSVWGHLVSFIRKTDVKKLERFVKAERGRRSARATGGGEARGEVVDGPGNGGSR